MSRQQQLIFSSDRKISLVDRKCLGVLQPNKQNHQSHSLVTSGNPKLHSSSKSKKNDENCTSVKSKRKDGIYEDPVPLFKKQKTFVTVSVQTDMPYSTTTIAEDLSDSRRALSTNDIASSTSQSDRTIDMLTSDVAPSKYWEELAEKRREALEETLEENHRLHDKNEALQQEIRELNKENKLLENMVEEAKDLAILVESLTSEAEPSILNEKATKE